MELLVLGVLDWRLRSITPFSFIAFFAYKLDSSGSLIGYLISRATQIILSNIQGNNSENMHAVEFIFGTGIFRLKQGIG